MNYAHNRCPQCGEAALDCDCAREFETFCQGARDYNLALVALGLTESPTLQDVCDAQVAQDRYTRAVLDAQSRQTRHISVWGLPQ